MSDYLWDKSGEPDAEVERLEELLGQLRHQPRPLELPAEPVARAPRRSFFRPAWAAAAALLLMFLAGLWFGVLRHRSARDERPALARNSQQPQRQQAAHDATAERETQPAHETASRATGETNVTPPREATPTLESGGRNLAAAGERDVRQSLQARASLQTRASLRGRVRSSKRRVESDEMEGGAPSRSRMAFVSAEMRRERSAGRETARAERQRAKEQVLLALRLTTDKLGFVQERTDTRARVKGGATTAPEENRMRLMK